MPFSITVHSCSSFPLRFPLDHHPPQRRLYPFHLRAFAWSSCPCNLSSEWEQDPAVMSALVSGAWVTHPQSFLSSFIKYPGFSVRRCSGFYFTHGCNLSRSADSSAVGPDIALINLPVRASVWMEVRMQSEWWLIITDRKQQKRCFMTSEGQLEKALQLPLAKALSM